MDGAEPFDILPMWGFFLVILFLVLLFVECGYRLGKYRNRSEAEKETAVGSMVTATLGLLAFMLAFTFGMASDRYFARRQVLLDEANAIGTTYLRARMLPDDRRDDIRALLRDYVEVRLAAVQSGNVTEAIRQSEHLHDQLWAQAVALGENNPTSIVVGLFIQSLNEMIDLHAKRVSVAVRNRIPGPIWATLFAVAAVSLAAMGYQAGISRTHRSLAALAVAFTFTAVIGLIADLDRPQEGMLKVSQQALIDLQDSMQGK